MTDTLTFKIDIGLLDDADIVELRHAGSFGTKPTLYVTAAAPAFEDMGVNSGRLADKIAAG
ncbi:hypothetical protein sS8_2631 [Methylocaldum marinum]|uniref:Uncharacterized protein n=1 Tax=Methylocaldum marinum TaxID=1432792 RepID=A0A250KXS9_9GAMM|nr:hypothetical protein sS8_2631 [Methylocaldum marinum]